MKHARNLEFSPAYQLRDEPLPGFLFGARYPHHTTFHLTQTARLFGPLISDR
jgi:hypothetical protein